MNKEGEYNDYILIVGEVKTPALSLTSSRFNNAILAPAGRMFVGKKVVTKIVLKNMGNVSTFFTWGRPFGCHSRKIQVDISPNEGTIELMKKLEFVVTLDPLDEVWPP